MSAPIIRIRPRIVAEPVDPTNLPPPHGPDHRGCLPCERLRVAIGHVPLDEMERERCLTG